MKRATSKHHSGLWELVMATLNNFLPFYKVTKWIEWTGHDNNLQLQPWWDPRRCFGSKRSCWGSFCNFLCRLRRTPDCGCAGLWSVCVSCGGYVMCCAVCSLSLSLFPQSLPPSLISICLILAYHTHTLQRNASPCNRNMHPICPVWVWLCVCVCVVHHRGVWAFFCFPACPPRCVNTRCGRARFIWGFCWETGRDCTSFWGEPQTITLHVHSRSFWPPSFLLCLSFSFLSLRPTVHTHTHTHTHTRPFFFPQSCIILHGH